MLPQQLGSDILQHRFCGSIFTISFLPYHSIFFGHLTPPQMAGVSILGSTDIILHILSSSGSRCGQQLVSPLL